MVDVRRSVRRVVLPAVVAVAAEAVDCAVLRRMDGGEMMLNDAGEPSLCSWL